MAERNRGKQRRSDSRDRGDRNRGGGGKNGERGDHHHRRGGDSASSAGVPEGAAEGATFVQQPGQLAAALAEATEGGGMTGEDVQRGKARQPPPARLRLPARTSEVVVVAGKKCQEQWQEEHLGLRLLPSCCVC